MEITLEKYNTTGAKNETKSYPILEFKPLVHNSSLLIVRHGEMGINTGVSEIRADFKEIFKVQFIASCKIEMTDNLIIAFYFAENELTPYILDGLPLTWSQVGDCHTLFDYKNYSEICELTGETKLSILDYISEIRDGNLGINTLLIHNNEILNADKQKNLWNKIDKEKVEMN